MDEEEALVEHNEDAVDLKDLEETAFASRFGEMGVGGTGT